MSKKIDEIELRSKEVQDLLGKVPSWLIRNGIAMMMVLLIVLVSGSWLFKYPDIVSAPVVVVANTKQPNSLTGYVKLKANVAKIKIGQRVNLKFVSYPYLEYGIIKGVVGKIAVVPTGDSYEVEINLPNQLVSTYGKNLEFQQELKGSAEIITEERRLLDRILHPVMKY
jgi:hypothetical protein